MAKMNIQSRDVRLADMIPVFGYEDFEELQKSGYPLPEIKALYIRDITQMLKGQSLSDPERIETAKKHFKLSK